MAYTPDPDPLQIGNLASASYDDVLSSDHTQEQMDAVSDLIDMALEAYRDARAALGLDDDVNE